VVAALKPATVARAGPERRRRAAERGAAHPVEPMPLADDLADRG
jgi:hypothetical protein